MARALADNPELRAARAEVEAARGRLRQAGLRPNPMLDLGGQQNVAGPDNNVTIGLTVPLDLNGRKEGRVGVAEREVEMKQAQVADRERRLVADVRLKAGELLAARRNLGTTTELLEVNRTGARPRPGAREPGRRAATRGEPACWSRSTASRPARHPREPGRGAGPAAQGARRPATG